MADETIKIKVEVDGVDNVANDLENATEATKSLKAQLREATLELQKLQDTEGIDPEKIRQQAMVVGELKDKIGEANEMAQAFSGNTFENMSTSLRGVQEGLLTLDFGKANEMAKNFAATSKSISFSGAISSVKQLGRTFMSLGKAILTNPIFLLVGVIVAIVAAIVKLLDKIGVLKVIMEAIGKVFKFVGDIINDYLIQPLKDLADWFGITNNAAQDAAQAQADAAKTAADAQKNAGEEIVQSLDHQIKMRELEGKSTVDLERKKVQELRKTAQEQAKADRLAYQAAVIKGDLDEEELKNLKEKARQSRLAYQQSVNDVKYFEAEVRAEHKKTQEELVEKQKEADAKQAEEEKKAYAERIQRAREYASNRLAAQRQLEDINLALMKEGVDKELKEVDIKYRRLIEDTKKNEKLLQSERDAIISAYELQRASERDAINQRELDKQKEQNKKLYDDEVAANQKRIELEDAQFELEQSLNQSAYDKEIADLVAQYEAKFEIANGNAELEKQLQEQQKKDIAAINKKYADQEEADEEERRQKKLANIQKTNQLTADLTKGSLQGISDLVNAFAGKSVAAQKKAFETTKKLNIAMATIDMIKGAVSAFTGMISTIPGPVGIALGAVAAAGVVASGIANIKKITDTKFEGGGGSSTPSAPAVGGSTGGGEAAPTPPAINLFGTAGSTVGGMQQEQGMRQQNVVKAVVVESDITNTQRRLATYQQRSEIG